MSGGVDSAVAALLCAREGETVAVTLELWADPENDAERSCCSATAVAQARALAHSMGLPHFTIDLRDEFRAGVVEPFIAGYAAGETPNPCVGCNGHVRLDAMLELADRLGCDTLATGHYARTAEPEHRDGPLLRVAADPAKDQTYMLAALSPQSLARMRFPLGDLTKPEVGELAAAGRPARRQQGRLPGPVLHGRHRPRPVPRAPRRARRRLGPIVDQDGRRPRPPSRPAPLHGRPAARPRHRAPASRCTCSTRTRDEPRPGRSRARRCRPSRAGPQRPPSPRPGARVDRVKLRYRSRPLPLPWSTVAAGGRQPALDLELSRAGRRRRARPAGLPDGRRAGGRSGDDRAARRPPARR